MADSIETFVAKLQAEGVEEGRRQAEQIIAEGRRQADDIVGRAKQQASEIVGQANQSSQEALAKGQTELRLATRDAILRLRQALGRVLDTILRGQVSQVLSDGEFIRQVLHELILEYARAEIDGSSEIWINVTRELRDKLSAWAIGEIRALGRPGHLSIELHGELKSAGFEYNVTGATVEVTVDSVVEMLAGLVTPKLAEMVREAAGKMADSPEKAG